MDDLTGKQLGQYRIISQIGRGGMAEVYKAYQPNIDRYVAIKVLPRFLATDPKFLVRFQQEAKLIANLEHTNILPVYDFGEEDGYTYIVMRFVEYSTLEDEIRRKLPSLSKACKYVIDVASALDHAHERGLVHLDVKPSNILLDKHGHCYLSDFGTAKIFLSSSKSDFGMLVGTPFYMSPEQSSGEQHLDGRSDIYSLGIVLYETVTGRVPFFAETPLAVIFKHIQEALPLPSMINPAIPPSVEEIILKTLAKNPVDRFATAGEMAEALTNALITIRQHEDEIIKNRFVTGDRNRMNVFICHSPSDELEVAKLYDLLNQETWIDPWLDTKKILPGERLETVIIEAVQAAHILIVCLSRKAIEEEGYIQKLIKIALDLADEKPESTIYLIPLKLEECSVPRRLSPWQSLNYFEREAHEKLLLSLKKRAQSLGIDVK